MNKFKISAIVCAAGLSSRMGEKNKLLLPFNGKSLILHTIDELLDSEITDIIVVVGYEQNNILKEINSRREIIKIVHNPNFDEGHISSIVKGLKHMDKNSTAFMICLSDMPLLSSAHYNFAIQHFRSLMKRHARPISRPLYDNKPGHPVIMHHTYKSHIMSTSDKNGCKQVIKDNGEYFYPFETEELAYYLDVDTESAYLDLCAKEISKN